VRAPGGGMAGSLSGHPASPWRARAPPTPSWAEQCDLSEMSLARLKIELVEIIHSREVQMLLIELGPTDGRGAEVFESLGKKHVDTSGVPQVI
jgi:hypothetical protein